MTDTQRYNTGNDLGSNKLEDLSDNAKNIDNFANGESETFPDRFGAIRKSIAGMESEFITHIEGMGWTPAAGSFQVGGTITDRNQTLYDEVSHVFYAWGGTIPVGGYVVPAGSAPSTAGGVGVAAWADKTDLMLRSDMCENGGIRLSSACASISELLTLSNPINDQRVDVLGFYTDNLHGGGTFRFRATYAKSGHNGVTVISPTVPFSGLPAGTPAFLAGTGETDQAGSGCWVRIMTSPVVTTAMAGAVRDLSVDDQPMCQSAHDTGYHVEYTEGSYNFESGVTPKPNQRAFSQGAGLFNLNSTRNVYIENLNEDGSIFHYTSDTSWGQVDAPHVYGMNLKADYPIMLNSFMATIADGSASNCPYLMKPMITNNNILARVTGTGIGVCAAKCFDGEFSGNDIYGFTIPLLLLGSDLNEVHRNRIVGHTLYGICERSVGSFGSQNSIDNNDILAGGPTSTYIKSTARHVRLSDNYCEQPPGTLKGFIDLTKNGLPVWNPLNLDANPQSIFVKENRLDGWAFCTDFVYAIDGDNPAVMTVIEDASTTGETPSVEVLKVITADSAGMLKYAIGCSNQNFPEYYLRGQFGKFSGFDTQFLGADLDINARNLTKVIGGDIYGNGADSYVKTNGESFCILPGFTQPFYMRFHPDKGVGGTTNNAYLADGVTYTCTILARTTTPIGDTLKAARLVNTNGDALIDFSLTNQWKKFTFTMSGTASSNLIGVYLVRGTQNGVIEIKSISFTQ